MPSINGTASFIYYPSAPNGARPNYDASDYQQLKSANQPLVFCVAVDHNGNGLDYEPQNAGDVVNVLFDVYATGANSVLETQYQKAPIATIRKAMDIPLEVYSNDLNIYFAGTGLDASGNLTIKTFTVDIRSIIQPRLSYGLIPCGRGSFNSNITSGSMGAGFTGQYGDRIFSPIGQGLQKVNVKCRFEQLDSAGNIEESSTVIDMGDLFHAGTWGPQMMCINSVRQMENDQDMNSYMMRMSSFDRNGKFLSMCPNGDTSANWSTPRYYKWARTDELQDALYFNLFQVEDSSTYTWWSGPSAYQGRFLRMSIKVEAVDASGASTGVKYLNATEDCFWYSTGFNNEDIVCSGGPNSGASATPGNYLACTQYPRLWLAQNVSPFYINTQLGTGTATPITASTDRYRVSIVQEDNESGSCDYGGSAPACPTGECCEAAPAFGSWAGAMYRTSEFRYFKIDHTGNNEAFPHVRLHWLNALGGIDSYTFKRNKTEAISRTLSTYERKPNDPQWTLEVNVGGKMVDTTYANTQTSWSLQTGSDQYKSSVEVMSVQSVKGGTVYSEALEKPSSNWLSELMKSPNVWIQVDNGRAKTNAVKNDFVYSAPDLFGSDYNPDYAPIIIDEGEMITVDEEQRLVQIQISYKYSNAEMTQGN